MSSRIRAARTERAWSQTRLILELERVAGRSGTTLPSRQTLKSRVSRWENGHAVPDEFYRQLLREVFGLDDRELGFEYRPDDRAVSAAEDLRLSLVAALEADDHLVEVLRSQTQAIRMQDRQFGAGTLLEVARGHVAGIERHVSHAVVERLRRLLAEELADASALAGWQAMDVGAQDQSWRFFELSAAAALRADDRSLFAFARLEQAHLVSELAGSAVAANLASSIWSEAHRRVSAPMRCWMAAAVAELQAVDEPVASRRMLERAESLIDAVDEAPPYVVLDRTHLARWSGHTLVLMHDPGAEPLLLQAEASMPRTFIRAQASLNLDLAAAIAWRGDREAAAARMTKANELARRVGSRRLLARLEALRAAS